MVKLYQTYTESVNAYLKDNSIHKVEQKNLLKDYAKFLDGFQVADDKLQIAALQAARKQDREMIHAMIDALGVEKSTEIARNISNKHRHYSQWQDKNAGKLSRILGRLTWQFGKLMPKARSWGLTKPTEELPADKQKDLNDVRKTG